MRVAKAEEKGRERNGEVARVTECSDFLHLDCGLNKYHSNTELKLLNSAPVYRFLPPRFSRVESSLLRRSSRCKQRTAKSAIQLFSALSARDFAARERILHAADSCSFSHNHSLWSADLVPRRPMTWDVTRILCESGVNGAC